MALLKVSALAGAAAAWLPVGAARLCAQPSRGGGPGAVRPGLTGPVPGPVGRHPGWFAADRVGPRSRAPPIRRQLVPDQSLQAKGGRTHCSICEKGRMR
jgi:hypothetical protein